MQSLFRQKTNAAKESCINNGYRRWRDFEICIRLRFLRTPSTRERTIPMVRKGGLSRHLQRRGFLRVTHFFGCLSLLLLLPMAGFGEGTKPNILVIFGDDVGQTNISRYSHGLVGYTTPNIDRVGEGGITFTDYYAENSCTAGRSTFITGQAAKRTGLSKVGLPGANAGLQARDITIAQASETSRLCHGAIRQEPSGR